MEVRLISGVSDPLGWALRALRKAHAKGLSLWVTVDRDQSARLLHHVCAADPQGFLPLAAPDAPTHVRRRSRIHLHHTEASIGSPPPGTHWLNLGSEIHPELKAFAGVVDCVPADEAAAQRGRQRYRLYQQMGCEVIHSREGA